MISQRRGDTHQVAPLSGATSIDEDDRRASTSVDQLVLGVGTKELAGLDNLGLLLDGKSSNSAGKGENGGEELHFEDVAVLKASKGRWAEAGRLMRLRMIRELLECLSLEKEKVDEGRKSSPSYRRCVV